MLLLIFILNDLWLVSEKNNYRQGFSDNKWQNKSTPVIMTCAYILQYIIICESFTHFYHILCRICV